MKDHEFYHQLLGLEKPWCVEEVKLDISKQEVEVVVECQDQNWACPECHQRMHVHQWKKRRWRHLDSCQFKTFLEAKVPVVQCPEHGTQTVKVPWAEKRARFTSLFECLAIQILRACSVSEACVLLRVSWDEADGFKQRAVQRGLSRKKELPIRRLGVDEKAAGKGHDYITVVARMVEGGPAVVEYLGDGRKQEALDGFWETKTQEQRQGVEAISMDLWEAYRNSTIQYLPGALEKIVYDPFHLMKHLNQAVDTVRKQEHRILMKQGDGRLSGSKYSWLKGMENLSSTQVQTFNELKSQKLQTSRAWAIKEMFRDFWNCSTGQEAKEYFTQWYDWAIRSRMDPIKKVAKMFKRHLNNILTYFRFHLSNAALEGLNSRISNIIKKACGYRNRERFKADILFHLGGLDLFPGQEKITT